MAFKRRLKFDKRIRFQKKMNIIYILLFIVLASTGIGYSYIKSNLNINGTANVTAARWDVHFTNLNVTTGSVTATTAASITDPTTVTFAATLDEPNDFYEFTVDVTNQGTMDAMIDSFSISPTLTTAQKKYLEYTIVYSDGTSLENKQELKQGTSETIKVRFSYIENSDKTNYPTEDQQFTIEFTMTYTQADETAIDVEHSFSNESWENIIENIKTNRIPDYYTVGASKEVNLGTLGVHTLRIANTSTPSECSNSGFSQTACGIVFEFADIIDEQKMNSSETNEGGWEAAELRTYLNSTVYNLIPEIIRNNIIDTYVVSGHGKKSGESNFITTDKLYLLSTKEVWGKEGTTNVCDRDTAEVETRQLDYYKAQGIRTDSNNGAIKKYNGNTKNWWLRTADNDDKDDFMRVNDTGHWGDSTADVTNYISPAFRIG
ncbi:MAG: hypothetical protein IKE63_01615 [Bacilli bacterium]|nr:hypothetical protein [Bacilli bacterium]